MCRLRAGKGGEVHGDAAAGIGVGCVRVTASPLVDDAFVEDASAEPAPARVLFLGDAWTVTRASNAGVLGTPPAGESTETTRAQVGVFGMITVEPGWRNWQTHRT